MIESIFICHLLCSRVSEDLINLKLLPCFPSYREDPGESLDLVGWKTRMVVLEEGVWTSIYIRCQLMYLYNVIIHLSIFSVPVHAVDSVDPGVHRGRHRLPPGGVLRLLGPTPGSGPEGAGAPEGVRHPPGGHVRHRLPHQLRGDHDPQHSLRARGHLDHQLRWVPNISASLWSAVCF